MPTKKTAASQAILQLIQQSPVALSASEIGARLPIVCDRVTVYRVLDRMVDEDIAHKIATAEGVTKYASCPPHGVVHFHHHAHFECDRCQQTQCLNEVEIPFLELPEGFQMREAQLVVRGICAQCS